MNTFDCLVMIVALVISIGILWMRSRLALMVGAIAVLAAILAIAWARPIVKLPRPGGPFAVGTTEFHFTDSSRPEMHTANPLDRRELMVRAWYPAGADSKSEAVPYWPDAAMLRRAINKDNWPYGWLASHLDAIPTHSFRDAPLAQARPAYPVLVFSHGLSLGRATQNTVLLEELASRGYVIFSIDHPYDGLATVFPDGRIARFSGEAYDVRDDELPDDLARRSEQVRNSMDPIATRRVVEHLVHAQPREAQLRRYWYDVWSGDQRFVIDEIQKLQSGARRSPFAGHLQLDRLGVFGMSFGGVAAALTCSRDSRCKAGINMDGFGDVAVEFRPQSAPFLYFNNGRISWNSVFLERDKGYRYFVQVAGAEHMDFSDSPLLTPLAKLAGASGEIDTLRMLSLLNAYVTAFFDRHLLERPSDLLKGPAKAFPEVKVVARAPEQPRTDMSAIAPTASGMAAKLACSGVFVSGRKLPDVVKLDIERLSPIAIGVQYQINATDKVVTATRSGSTSQAIYRPGVGCTLLNDTDKATLLAQAARIVEPSSAMRDAPWPAGDNVNLDQLPGGIDKVELNRAVANAFDDETPAKDIDTRAIVVVRDGQIVAERYAPGYTNSTRFLGWSASKSVLGALIGALVADGKLLLDQPAPVPEWQGRNDERSRITLDQLMHMSSGLGFSEPYTPGSDSTTMLFRRGDMGGYAAGKPLLHDPGVFWLYSSGTSNLLSRIAMQASGGSLESYHTYVRRRIFDPAGMRSFVLEPDATGAFVGSSYAYATARDWARFGLLHLNRGEINGRRILPESWVDYVRTAAPADRHSYFGAHFWLNVRRQPGAGEREYPHLPEDLYMAHGHNTQLVAIVPSHRAVIVRLGWTTEAAEFDIDRHFAAILRALH